jgi:type I restriction enzyme S subunit
LPEFYCRFLNSSKGKNQINKLQAGGAQQNLNVEMMKEILIPLPPLEEQKKIADILTSIDDSIQQEEKELEQTQNLKKSLMQDLLTGKVRVKVD